MRISQVGQHKIEQNVLENHLTSKGGRNPVVMKNRELMYNQDFALQREHTEIDDTRFLAKKQKTVPKNYHK